MSGESERKKSLRKGTRKNYNKMQNDVDGVLNPDLTDRACVDDVNNSDQQKHQHEEHELSDALSLSAEENESNVSEVEETDEDSDDELTEAEIKLELMKKEFKILQKEEKRARIAKETEELERALKSLKKSKPSKKHVTATTLRAMDDVVDEVDKLMDRNMNFNKNCGSSSEAESDVVSTASRRVKKVEQVKVNRAEKKTSGKSKTLLDSECEFPQKWPHNFLNPHFVSCKDKKSYEDLSMSEFCAAYMTILEKESEDKLMHRIAHLKELMYLSSRFKWRSVLDYHGACLLEIERGQLKWGESFQLLQSTTLAGNLLVSNNRGGAGAFNSNRSQGAGNNVGKGDGVVFCKAYQTGTCQLPSEHYGIFFGVNRLQKHICGNCWIKMRVQVAHPETSDECPLKGQQ